MKRLLAYSSIENIGIMLAGIGLTILFHANHQEQLAALALIATLYHALNHAFIKSLLFLGTGSVLHSTGERQSGQARRPDPQNALGCCPGTGRRAGDFRPAAAERLCFGMAAAAGLPAGARYAPALPQHAAAAGRGHAGLVRRAGGLRHGQVLRGHFSRSAAR